MRCAWILATLAAVVALPAVAAPHWCPIYRNDAQGAAVAGRKRDLIAAVRSGEPLRVGFGLGRAGDADGTVEHFADARFLTLANQNDVYAQVGEYATQAPAATEPTVTFMAPEVFFSTMVGTTGVLENVVWDRQKVKGTRVPSIHVPVTWYTAGHEGRCPIVSGPLVD